MTIIDNSMRIDLVGTSTPTVNLFQPYVDEGVEFTCDHTMSGQLHCWGNSKPHELRYVVTTPSVSQVLPDDPRPLSHVAHIGLVHGAFDTGRIQCDLAVVDSSGAGPVATAAASNLLAMSAYRGNSWSVGDATRLLVAGARRVDATTDQLRVVDASGVEDTGVTLHVFTTVPYAQTAHVGWARLTVRLTVQHTPVCSPLVLPLDLSPSRPTFPTSVPAWCAWWDDATTTTTTARMYTSGRVGCVLCACVDGERPPTDPLLLPRHDRVAVLNTWIPGQHVVQFRLLHAPSSGRVCTLASAERVVLVVTSSRMELEARASSSQAASGSPIVFQSSVRKFTSLRRVWCAQGESAHDTARTYSDYCAAMRQRWYDQVIRPILVGGLFRACSEISSTSRLLAYDADGPVEPPPLYAQPYVGAYKAVQNARILNAFVDCETPRQTSISTSVLTSYLRRFMQSLLFHGEDAQPLAGVSCASSMSAYATSLLEQYASSAVHDRVLIVLPALTVPSGGHFGGGGATATATRIYARVNADAAERGAFLVVVRIDAVGDIDDDDDASGAPSSLLERPRWAQVAPFPSFAWTTPEWIEEGLTYTHLIARIASAPSLSLTSDTLPVWCAWSPDASGFVASKVPTGWPMLPSLQIVHVAIVAPAASYARIDASGVVQHTGGEMTLHSLDVQSASYDHLTQTVHVRTPVVVYDVDVAYMRLTVWSPTIDHAYQIESAPKRVSRQVNAGAIRSTFTIAHLDGSTWPIVLIRSLPIWVEFAFSFPGNKTCFSGPVDRLLGSMVSTPTGACTLSSFQSVDGIRFGQPPEQPPTSLVVQVTLSDDYHAIAPPPDIQFVFQMAGSSSRIPFTLPSSQVWAFPSVKSTIVLPGVVALGETVGFETQFDVPCGPCPPSESWLVVHVLIAPIGKLQFVNSDSLDRPLVDASGALAAYWRSNGLDASCVTVGTWAPSASAVATLRYAYPVQEDVAHGCLMQMRIGASLSPIFTWTASGSILPTLDDDATTPLAASNIYTFPTELVIVSTSTGESGVFRALQTVDLPCVRLVGGDGLSLGVTLVRAWATFTSSSSSGESTSGSLPLTVDCSGCANACSDCSGVEVGGGVSDVRRVLQLSRVPVPSGYDAVVFSVEIRTPFTMVHRTIRSASQHVVQVPTIRVRSQLFSVDDPGYVLVDGHTVLVSFTFTYGQTTQPDDDRNAFTLASPSDYFSSMRLVDGSGNAPTGGTSITDGRGNEDLCSSSYFDTSVSALRTTITVPIALANVQPNTDLKCAFIMRGSSVVVYSEVVHYAQMYRFPTRLSVSFPHLPTTALVDASGCVIVTVGRTVRCAVSLAGGSGVLPIGGTHHLQIVNVNETTIRDYGPATLATSQLHSDVYIQPPSTETTGSLPATITATLRLSFGGFDRSYSAFALCAPYTFPTSLASTVQFTGTNAITPDDESIRILALGAAYGSDTASSPRSVCGVGNASRVVLTLGGGDVGSSIKPTTISAVQVVDASGVGYGTVGGFDYTSPTVAVRSYTLPTDRLPTSAVCFRVTMVAPDATTTVTITSSTFDVIATPTSCSIGTLVGSAYALVDGSTVQVPFALSAVANNAAFGTGLSILGAIDSVTAPSVVFGDVGTFASVGAFTVQATYAGDTGSAVVTLIMARTRARVTTTIQAYKFPSDVSYAFPSTLTANVASSVTATLNTPILAGATWSVSASGGVVASGTGTATSPGSIAIPFTLTPSANVDVSANVALTWAGLSRTVSSTVATAAQVYAWPSSVTAVLALNGATSGADYNVLGFAAGRSYGSASTLVSSVTITLQGTDADTPHTSEVANSGAVSVYINGVFVTSAVVYTYRPATHDLVVHTMTLGTQLGALEFVVTVTAPSGQTTSLRTSGHSAVAVPDTVVISTLGDGYSLIASNAIQTQFTFSNTNSALRSAIEIGTFSSGASTSILAVSSITPTIPISLATTFVEARVLGATVTATTTAQQTLTFTFASTRTVVACTVPTTSIYTFPTSATCAVVANGGGTVVTVGSTAVLTWTTSVAVPIMATHSTTGAGATYVRTTASPIANTRTASIVYAISPTAKQDIVCTLTLSFGGVSATFTRTALPASSVADENILRANLVIDVVASDYTGGANLTDRISSGNVPMRGTYSSVTMLSKKGVYFQNERWNDTLIISGCLLPKVTVRTISLWVMFPTNTESVQWHQMSYILFSTSRSNPYFSAGNSTVGFNPRAGYPGTPTQIGSSYSSTYYHNGVAKNTSNFMNDVQLVLNVWHHVTLFLQSANSDDIRLTVFTDWEGMRAADAILGRVYVYSSQLTAAENTRNYQMGF